MNKKLILAILVWLAAIGISYSQGKYVPNLTIPVNILGTSVQNPWAGGLNAPIFSEIDLNGDNRMDLFIFDKDGDRITTYINNGTPNAVDYHYAPEYRSKFPAGMHDWVLLKDFNCDGKMDLFTYSYSAGMTVYRNDYTPQAGLKFNLVHSLVYSQYGPINSNLYVSAINLPALVDVDFDGDLDVLTFPVSGNFIEYHKNMAQENFGKCDTLVYQLDSQMCWGNFGLSGFSNSAILGVVCRMANPGDPGYKEELEKGAMHSGSCMLAFDDEGDMDVDLLNGDVLGNNILYLRNGGTNQSANITSQDTIFPAYDTPVDLITFPAPYYFDVNNDGKKDLVVAPCISGGSAENFNNVLYYKNTTNNNTNVFNYQKNRFLSDEMIETGTAANPVFHDVDSDGLIDIIVGNYGYFNPGGNFESGLSFYKNTGTNVLPAYQLMTIDFGSFMQLPNTGLFPAFGDIDNDGDADLFMGESDGSLMWYENTAGPGNFPAYTLKQAQVLNSTGSVIDVGQFSTPQLVDINRDGKLDLVIGEKTGNLNFYENTGTSSVPEFTFFSNTFGGINVTKVAVAIYGYSQPFFYDSLGVWKLYVGTLSGYIYNYDNIDNNLGGTFNLLDSVAFDIFEPSRSTINGANIDGDPEIEFIVGTNAGGITLYDFDSSVGLPSASSSVPSFAVFPNPADDELYIKFDSGMSSRKVRIFDSLGQLVLEKDIMNNVEVFNISSFADGIYFCQVIEDDKPDVRKFVVRH